MGIYDDGYVYGLSWKQFDDKDVLLIEFQQTYDHNMSMEEYTQIKPQFEHKIELKRKRTLDVANLFFYVYRKYTSTYSMDYSSGWFQWDAVSVEFFESIFISTEDRKICHDNFIE